MTTGLFFVATLLDMNRENPVSVEVEARDIDDAASEAISYVQREKHGYFVVAVRQADIDADVVL